MRVLPAIAIAVAFVACAPVIGHNIPAGYGAPPRNAQAGCGTIGNTSRERVVLGCSDGGGAPPTPSPSPNAAAENACNAGGGTFYSDTGGSTGVLCAGISGGPSAITSYNARCGYTIDITAGNGAISKGGSVLGRFKLGVEVAADCSYSMFS